MKNFTYNDIEFSYADEPVKEYIKSLQLKSFDGHALFFHPKIHQIYTSIHHQIYFVEVRIENRELNKQRTKELIEKYKKIYHYTRYVYEYILLINDNPIYVFADISCYADGESVKLLEVVSDLYTPEDMKWIRAILCKSFNYLHRNCPEYYYDDNYAVFSLKK